MTKNNLASVLLILVVITVVLDLNVLLIVRRRPELQWVAKGSILATALLVLGVLVYWFFGGE